MKKEKCFKLQQFYFPLVEKRVEGETVNVQLFLHVSRFNLFQDNTFHIRVFKPHGDDTRQCSQEHFQALSDTPRAESSYFSTLLSCQQKLSMSTRLPGHWVGR